MVKMSTGGRREAGVVHQRDQTCRKAGPVMDLAFSICFSSPEERVSMSTTACSSSGAASLKSRNLSSCSSMACGHQRRSTTGKGREGREGGTQGGRVGHPIL